MNNIKLPYPILLHTPTTEDLPEEQSKQIYRLLCCADRWRNGEIIPTKYESSKAASESTEESPIIYGSAAAIAYCEREGIKAYIVTELVPDELLVMPPYVYEAWDILNPLCRIGHKVNRINKLKELNAPEIIMMNEGRQLWEKVEQLFFNNTCVLKPDTYEHEDENGNVEHVPFKSVSDFVPDIASWLN